MPEDEQGFQNMSEEKHREISKKGGEASGGNTENLKNPGEGQEIEGNIGGQEIEGELEE